MVEDLQDRRLSTQLASYPVLLSLCLVLVTLAFWLSKKQATTATDAPVVGIDSRTWFSSLRGKYQYIRNGYWTIHEGYSKVCARPTG